MYDLVGGVGGCCLVEVEMDSGMMLVSWRNENVMAKKSIYRRSGVVAL